MFQPFFSKPRQNYLFIFGIGIFMVFIISMPIIGMMAVTNLGALASAAISIYDGPAYHGNTYAFGNCTYWVYIERAKINEPIPSNWGNAADWAVNAQRDGYTVDHIPSVGSIMQISTVDHGLGHVAFVENVDQDGNWQISEMNVVGLDEVDTKILSPAVAYGYNFIH
jgi:surface antigen